MSDIKKRVNVHGMLRKIMPSGWALSRVGLPAPSRFRFPRRSGDGFRGTG